MLFDYDAGDYQTSSLKIRKSGYIHRKDNRLEFSEKTKISEDCIKIAKLNINNDIYELDIDNPQKTEDDIPWIVIKHTNFTNKNGYRLKVGNIIRFGKSIFRITEIKNNEERNFRKFRDRTVGEHREEPQPNEYTDNNGNSHTDLGQSNSNVNFIQISRREKKESLINTKDNTRELYYY